MRCWHATTRAHAAALAPAPRAPARATSCRRWPSWASRRADAARSRTTPASHRRRGAALDAFLARLGRYDRERDFPALDSTSRLSVHLRFGTMACASWCALLPAREQDGGAGSGDAVWLSELIWREFYMMILWRHPRVVDAVLQAGLRRRALGRRRRADALFAAWCEGRTGYPLVDAAMAQLNQTGFMHNRLRMVTASFLTKDLGIDWRRGERYFALRLIDYELQLEQRRLAVGGVDRLRRPAVVPHLQSGHAVAALRSGRRLHPPLAAGAGPAGRQGDPRAVAGQAGAAGRGRRGAGTGLPGAASCDHDAARGRRWSGTGAEAPLRRALKERSCPGTSRPPPHRAPAARLPGTACRSRRRRPGRAHSCGACPPCAR